MVAMILFLLCAGALLVARFFLHRIEAREDRREEEQRATSFSDLYFWIEGAFEAGSAMLSLLLGVALIGLGLWMAWRAWF